VIRTLTRIQRFLRRIYEQATFKQHVSTLKLGLYEIRMIIGDTFARDWYDHTALHKPEVEWIMSHLNEDDIFVDCGAHQGLIAILGAKKLSRGAVFAFEAIPSNVKRLHANAELNGVRNLTIFPLAAGKELGYQLFKNYSHFLIYNSNGTRATTRWRSQEVPVISLDSALSRIRPTFVKIDVEGMEHEVLKGAQQIFSHRPKFDIEVHRIDERPTSSFILSVLDLLPKTEYQLFIQKIVDGEILPLQLENSTSTLEGCSDNVHLFGLPK